MSYDSSISPQCETQQLARDVIDAKEQMMKTLKRQPLRTWTARSLVEAACDGARGPVVSIAMWHLVSEGKIILDEEELISLA